ncbi:MAG: SDR family oxidoreductase [candidate division FCPU426 bacterium]
MSLAGKKVVISGASQGFGLALAKGFAAQGADLLLGARDLSLLETEAGRLRASAAPGQQILAKRLDVADETSARSFLEAAASWGKIDLLINNAGVYGPKGSLESTDWKAWVEAVQINLMGTVLMCKLALPALKKSAAPSIINLSGGGATAPLPRLSAYAASKAAVVRFTETLAEEWREEGICVNAVAPGALNTRLLEEVLEAGPEKVGQEFYAKSLEQKAKGGASMQEGVSLCLFLAGPQARGISGKLISALWDPWQDFAKLAPQFEKNDIYTLRRIVPKDRGMEF